jgi:filamentous hemagglutinin family protein
MSFPTPTIGIGPRKRRETFKPRKFVAALGVSFLLIFNQTAPLLANPAGGAVVAGGATIGSAGATLSINQSTRDAIINWQTFSIAGGETTKFIVPNSSSATLNRVVGGNPSAIYGSLQSNGILYLVNPSGIVVGPSGRIDTAGFLASTLDVSNEQFLKGGDLDFSGNSSATVDNQGTIHADSGDVYLIANQVSNEGTITAPHGTVGLAAGSDILFQQAGSQNLFVQATPAGTKRATGVTNAGTIRAAAAELKAAGGNAYALAINNTGVIAATGYKKVNGQVYLTADGGSISNSGKISARQSSGAGGTIALDGSGTSTSGTVINSGTLDASASISKGHGGSVTVKDVGGAAVQSGTILAEGGQGGVGGNVEVSGSTADLSGTVNTTAPGGLTGTLLIDPLTFVVAASGGNETGAAVATSLESSNVTLNADTNVTVNDAITWTSGNTLTISTNTAGSTINLNAPITGLSGGLTLDTAGVTDVITPSSSVDVASFILQNGYWSQNTSNALPAFSATTNFELVGGTFLRANGGNGGSTPYDIVDVYGLQGLASPSGNLLVANAELGANIDASGTVTWNGGAGFVPIGSYDFSDSSDAASYSGFFNGQGHTVDGLYENSPNRDSGSGLFGDTASASTIENLGVTNVNIDGSIYVGGLAGVCNSTVLNVYTSGSVTGDSYVGGMMGISSGAISDSYNLASVSGSSAVGGLDGYAQFGTITDCYSSGAVSGGGGLLGANGGTVTDSFWDITTSGQTTSDGGTGETTSALLMESTYTAAGWNIGTDLTANDWVIFDGQTRPLLSMEYSTTPSNAHQLQLIGLNATTLSANYTVLNNISLSGVTNPAEIWGTSTTNGGGGFVPIGNVNVGYGGTFNGANYVISDLYINTPSAGSVGLFGVTGTGSNLENVGVTDVSVSGNSDVGGLAGQSDGMVVNSFTSGDIIGSANGNSVAGLLGAGAGSVSQSYSTATVTVGTGAQYVGGLVGINLGTVSNAYSSGAVTAGSGSNQVGGLVGYNVGGVINNTYTTSSVNGGGGSRVGGLIGDNSGTVSNSFWDTDTGLVTVGIGYSTDGTGGVTAATTADLMSQSYILANAPVNPTWNFTTIWTTNGGTTTPQLIGLPEGPSGPSMGADDTLSGTAYLDSGMTADTSGVTVDLLYDGSLLGSTTTGSLGAFTFSVSSADLTGGVLVTDPADKSNTFYQANTPASSITGIDLWGSTLRIVADSASNTLLGETAGSLSGVGTNYSVSGANLTTAAGVGVNILSHYILDGNVTAMGSGSFVAGPSADLTGGAPVTITGGSVTMAGTFNMTGSLDVVSTTGDITLNNVGTPGTPAAAHGVTLQSAGSVVLNDSFLATSGGDFTGSGTGDSTDLNGVDLESSVIDSQGGSINLTGQASSAGTTAGIGVLVDSSTLETASSTEAPVTGNITINGNGSLGVVQSPVTVQNNLIGADFTHSIAAVVNGTFSMTGDVNVGTAAAVLNEDGSSSLLSGRAFGVIVNDGTTISSKGTGSVHLTGDTTGSVASLSNLGVDVSGLDATSGTIVNSYVTAGGGTVGVVVTGHAGAVAASPSGVDVDAPVTVGISVEHGGNITALGSAPITLAGTGGADENSSSAALSNESSEGIAIEASDAIGVGGTPDVTVASDSGNISLTGVGGSSVGQVEGIVLSSNNGDTASIRSEAANIALVGSTPNEGAVVQTVSTSGNGGTVGIEIGSDNATASVSSVTAEAGSVYLDGTVSSGTNNSQQAGVYIHGGAVVTASGTGGTAGAGARGDVTIVGDTTGSTAQSLNGGVFIEGAGTTITASGTVADAYEGTGLTITGISTGIDGSTGASVGGTNDVGGVALEPFTAGIGIVSGATLATTGNATMTLNGTGGTNANALNSGGNYVDPVTGATSGSYGVVIVSPSADQTTTVSSGGLLSLTGQAGSSPTTGVGVMIGGPQNLGDVSVSSAAAISIVGTGGSGNVAGSPVPNAGVAIFNPGNDSGSVALAAQGGDLSIIGTSGGGANSVGVDGAPYFNSVDDNASNDPSLTSSGGLLITSTAGRIDMSGFAGEISALNTYVKAPVGTSSDVTLGTASGPLSLYGGDFTVSGYPTGAITLDTSSVGSLSLTTAGGLTITGAVTGTGPMTLENTGGNITFGPGGALIDSGAGNNIVVAAGTDSGNGSHIINDSTVGAIQVADGANFYVYSNDAAGDHLGDITVLPTSVVYDTTYPGEGLPAVNEELFYTTGSGGSGSSGGSGGSSGGSGGSAGSGTGMTPPSTTTGGADGSGSDIIPPALVPQPTQVFTPTAVAAGGSGVTPPPFDFAGSGEAQQNGQEDGGLANSTGNSGQVANGDTAQLGNGQLNNVANPQAAGELNQALGPIVYQSLADALQNVGDWAGAGQGAADDTAGDDSGETILGVGDVAEMGSNGVQSIPLSKAPSQLRHAMSDDVRKGMGSGH